MAIVPLKYIHLWRLSKMNNIEKEVNQIRLHIYEKTKDMTPAQLTAYYTKSGEDSAKKYGFKIIQNAKEHTYFGNGIYQSS